MRTLTAEQKRILSEQAKIELAKRNFEDYLLYVHRGLYQHHRHTRLIARELQPIAEGKQRKIIIELPPRHSKSHTVSESFPSYFIGKNPTKRVIATAYGEGLARKFGRLNKQKLDEFGKEIFDVSIARDTSKHTNWALDGKTGGMLSTGIGGAITGEGADLLIVDDPFKNREEANSATIRNKIWDEWQNTLLTRLQKNASIIVIMTRWHQDDLVGRILQSEDADSWERIRLPALAEEDDLLDREVDEPLAPGMGYDEEWAEQKKREVGSMVWAALYQQRPSPAGGSIFKRHWIKYYGAPPGGDYPVHDLPKMFDKVIQSWDCSFKDTSKSDFVAGQIWSKRGADFYLLDRLKDRMGLPETIKAVRNFSAKWPEARAKYVEDKANGTAVIQMLEREISGLIPVEPEGGKEVRAHAVSPLFEAGNVWLPHPSIAPWVNDFVEELVSFPVGANDDEVDSCTQALNKLQGNKKNPLDRYKKMMGRK